MTAVNTLVVTGYGTNSEVETAHAAKLAGSDKTEIAFFPDVSLGRVKLEDYNFLIFPGGFLDGDDLGAAQAAALRWKHATTPSGRPLLADLTAFLERGGIVLGICNGFQLLVKLGLLPGTEDGSLVRTASLGRNDSARFEDRWVHLKADPASPCVFTRDIETLYLPVRHGEGKLVTDTEETLKTILDEHLVPLRYADPATGEPTEEYPLNPNGSPHGIASLTSRCGRVMGLMPHPEAYNHPTNHPTWTRGDSHVLGTELFAGGVRYLKGQ